MPTTPIDPLRGPKYVLEGRVVTMSGNGAVPEVLPNGAIYIGAGVIEAVQEASKPPPPGFDQAERIKTGDTIYPGLIELHNHLCYNAIPLWQVERKFTNNGQWRNEEAYPRLVTKPAQVLGRTAGVVEAMVRFVECRCLLGGVTTSQGITLRSVGGMTEYYKGIVRNVERTDHPKLPHAGGMIGNPKTGVTQAKNYLKTLKKHTCYLQHLSEGVDLTARGWFERLRIDDDHWAMNDAFSGIHGTALTAEDFQVITDHGGSMVWSPLSNYLLYGETADIQAAKDSGILMGIGCDWAPSGSKNLLGELKVAWLASEERGHVFTAKEIVAMATINGAGILKWDEVLGSIEPNKWADLVVIDGQKGHDYMRLIEARESDVRLVVIGGVPRFGQKSFMNRFDPITEEIKVGGYTRALNLKQETQDPLLQDLTLTEAIRRLKDALENLPSRAQDLDNASAAGIFGGSLDSQGETWRVEFDFDELELQSGYEFAAAEEFAKYVQPMRLEATTVVDDPSFLWSLKQACNLPEFVKKGLPKLYHMKVPKPDSVAFVEKVRTRERDKLLTSEDLKTFLRTWGELRLEDRKKIVDQALVLLEQNYVHLPLKRAMHAVDPIQRLKLLRHRLDEVDEGQLGPEIEFHNELTRIFNSLRDLHTTYCLPQPFNTKTAWLPFAVEECWEQGRSKYLVSKIVGKPAPPPFKAGVEILHWNGIPIQQAIRQNAERHAGSNEAARHARGIESLTIRPLAYGLPPDEEWVTVRYRDLKGKIREWTQEWLVFEPGRAPSSLDPATLTAAEIRGDTGTEVSKNLLAASALGLDGHTDEIQEAKKVLFAPDELAWTRAAPKKRRPAPKRRTGDQVDTYLPTLFRARLVSTSKGRFGYIRIFSFNVSDPEVFVNEFKRLVEEFSPEKGLIIDVRGNPGGHIHAAERLLQLLTPRRIEPESAQFVNSPVNLQLCRNNAPSSYYPDFSLKQWANSINQSVETGATYSLAYPITPREECNDIGQKYYEPVLLITDALCYSATDIFAAGFQDHGIGPILGVHTNTGAGGANVWSHDLLRILMRPPRDATTPTPSPYVPLPHGSDMRVAVRRTVRVVSNAGAVLEDLGVKPDHFHRMTPQDILGNNEDLIEKAAEILSGRKGHPIGVEFKPRRGALPIVRVRTRNISWVDVLVNDRPRDSVDIRRNSATIDLQRILDAVPEGRVKLELRGFDKDGEHVATCRRGVPGA